jgi:hypothetical protein
MPLAIRAHRASMKRLDAGNLNALELAPLEASLNDAVADSVRVEFAARLLSGRYAVRYWLHLELPHLS